MTPEAYYVDIVGMFIILILIFSCLFKPEKEEYQRVNTDEF